MLYSFIIDNEKERDCSIINYLRSECNPCWIQKLLAVISSVSYFSINLLDTFGARLLHTFLTCFNYQSHLYKYFESLHVYFNLELALIIMVQLIHNLESCPFLWMKLSCVAVLPIVVKWTKRGTLQKWAMKTKLNGIENLVAVITAISIALQNRTAEWIYLIHLDNG